MYAGRFILGIVGIEGGGVGVYISESVPSNKRGSLVSLYQLSIALGEVLGYAIAAIFYEVHGGWRFMVGSSLVFSTIVLIGLFFLPESRVTWCSREVWRSIQCVCSVEGLGDRHSKIEFVQMVQAAEAERVASHAEQEQGVV